MSRGLDVIWIIGANNPHQRSDSVAAAGWVCKACWKWNRPADERCWRCKTPRGASDAEIEEQRKAREARGEQPEAVPDVVVAVPVWVFRGYSKVWLRGGIALFPLIGVILFAGVTDPLWFIMTAGFGVGLIACGFLAGEVVDGMREREVWAFLVGIGLSAVGGISSAVAFQLLAPGLISPTAVRWGSLLLFGGAGIAAAAGLVMLWTRRGKV
jgi:hypothetical protein